MARCTAPIRGHHSASVALVRPARAAKELHDLLESRGVRVWFSEKDVALGTPLLREIDRGLAKSRVMSRLSSLS